MDLSYFVGKVCTINTVETNFRYKPEQMLDYFMGTVEAVAGGGVVIAHPVTKCKTFINLEYIVCIAEEQVLYEDNPDHAKVIEQYRAEKPETAARTTVTAAPQVEVSPYLDPKRLAELAKRGKG